MELTSLPAEILYHILLHVAADDFENAILSCQSLHSVASSLIERHNHRRRKYSSIWGRTDDDNDVDAWGRSFPQILYQIAQEPDLTYYVDFADLASLERPQSTADLPEDFQIEPGQTSSKAERAIQPLLRSSDYLSQLNPSPEFADQWLSRILDYSADSDARTIDYSVVFLLTLLPNLKTLALGNCWGSNGSIEMVLARDGPYSPTDDVAKRVPDLLELIVRRANDAKLSRQSLSKLKTLFPVRNIDRSSTHDVVQMMPFLALNSLQEFYHNFGYAEVKTGLLEDSCCSKHAQGSRETDSDADHSSTDAESDNEAEHDYVDDYMDDDDEDDDSEDDDSSDCSYDSNEPRREREEADYHSYDGCFMHPKYPVLGKNVETIIMHNMELFEDSSYIMFRDMHRLKKLQIRYADGDDHDMQWDIAGCITGLMCSVGANLEELVLEVVEVYEFVSRIRLSLHDFKVLKRLWLATVFFVNGAAAMANYRDEDAEADDKVANGPIEPLLYVLPPSLEHFILTVSSDHGKHLPLLFEGFTEPRQEHLPHLS